MASSLTTTSKKLFWAIWGDVFGKRPDPNELDQLRGTATIIHNNRLRGLYVEVGAENFIAPKDAVTDETLAPLMSLVEAKLALQPSLQGVEYRPEDFELLSWLCNANDDPEKRKFIFSQKSFATCVKGLSGRAQSTSEAPRGRQKWQFRPLRARCAAPGRQWGRPPRNAVPPGASLPKAAYRTAPPH